MIFSNSKLSQEEAIKIEQNNSKKYQKYVHPLLRPLINFWKFSCYYADYKAPIWDLK